MLDLDPSNLDALRALEALYEKTEQNEKYLEVLEAQLDATPSDAERVVAVRAHGRGVGRALRQARPRGRGATRRSSRSISRNYSAYRELARLYQQAGKYEALVETYRNHIAATTDVATRVELYVAMGQVYETQLHDVDRAIEAYNDVARRSTATSRARSTRSAGSTRRSASGTARSTCIGAPRPAHATIRASRSSCTGAWAGSSTASSATPRAPRRTCSRGLALDPGHVPTMEALTKQYSDRGDWLKAAQMMVRAESYTPVAIDKVRLLFEAANIYMYKLRAGRRRRSSCTPR